MLLHNTLQHCLLTLADKYPYHTIEIDSYVLPELIGLRVEWTAEELVDALNDTESSVLEDFSILAIDDCRCAIYLPQRSPDRVAAHVHCMGRVFIPYSRLYIDTQPVIAT